MQKEKGMGKIEKDIEMIHAKFSWRAGKSVVHLEGILKGLRIEEADIREARTSLFRLNGG